MKIAYLFIILFQLERSICAMDLSLNDRMHAQTNNIKTGVAERLARQAIDAYDAFKLQHGKEELLSIDLLVPALKDQKLRFELLFLQ